MPGVVMDEIIKTMSIFITIVQLIIVDFLKSAGTMILNTWRFGTLEWHLT